jgi:hypothetical protein
MVITMAMARREVRTIDWTKMCAAPLAGGVAMGVVCLLLRDELGVALAAGAVAYLAVVVGVERIVSPRDLRFMTDLVRRALPLRAAG